MNLKPGPQTDTFNGLFRLCASLALLVLLANCSGGGGGSSGPNQNFAAPQGFSAVGASDGVSLQWQQVANANGYAINRCTVAAGATANLCGQSSTSACAAVIGVTTKTSFVDPVSAGQAYCYSVKACGDEGATNCGPLTAPIAAARRLGSNQAIAVAHGEERIAHAGQVVTLNAYATNVQGTASFNWEQIGGAKVTVANANSATATFVAPVPANGIEELISFKLNVSDARGPGRAGKMAVTVYPSEHLVLKASVKLRRVQPLHTVSMHASGFGASDPAFQWTQVAPAAPKVLIRNEKSDNPSFQAPGVDAPTNFRFEVRYTDRATGKSVVEKVQVEVATPGTVASPTPLNTGVSVAASPQALRVQAGAVLPVVAGARVTLAAAATGGGNTYAWSWTQTGGTPVALSNAASPTPTLTAPAVTAPEVLTFQVAVTAAGQSATALVRVPVAPAAAAGPRAQVVSRPVRTTTVGQTLVLTTSLATPVWEQIAGVVTATSVTSTGSLTLTAPNIVGSSELVLFRVTGTSASGDTVREVTPVNIIRSPSVLPPAQTPTSVGVVAPTLNAPLSLVSVGIDRADEGQRGVVLGVQAVGGSGNYTYSWSYQPQAGDPSVTLRDASLSHPNFDAPGVSGNSILRFIANVSDGGQSVSLPVFVVINDLAASVNVGSLPDISVPSGHQVSLHAPSVNGGVPPYVFSVVQTSGPSVGNLAGGNPVFPAPVLTAGAADAVLGFEYTIRDAVGNETRVSERVTVQAPPPPLAVTLNGPASGNQGSSVSLNTNVVGGVAPYTYSYTVAGGTASVPGSANPTLVLPTLAAGAAPLELTVTLTVTDSAVPARIASAPPLKISVAPPAALPASTDNSGIPASAAAYTGNAARCLICGDEDLGTFCTDLDLVLGDPTPCPAGKNWCMQTVKHDSNGVQRGFINYCGTTRECHTRWWTSTSDKVPLCTDYQAVDSSNVFLRCTWCCSTSDCNLEAPMPRVFSFTYGREQDRVTGN